MPEVKEVVGEALGAIYRLMNKVAENAVWSYECFVRGNESACKSLKETERRVTELLEETRDKLLRLVEAIKR